MRRLLLLPALLLALLVLPAAASAKDRPCGQLKESNARTPVTVRHSKIGCRHARSIARRARKVRQDKTKQIDGWTCGPTVCRKGRGRILFYQTDLPSATPSLPSAGAGSRR